MGTIVEFYTAQQPTDLDMPPNRGCPTLVRSLSINSHMVEVLLDALVGMGMGILVGDGSDVERSVFVAPPDLRALKAQSSSKSTTSGDVRREIYDAISDGADEAIAAKRGLVVVVR